MHQAPQRLTDFEPYVTDPAERPPRPWLAGLTPLVIWIMVAVLLLAGARLLLSAQAEDPSLQAPTEASAPPDG